MKCTIVGRRIRLLGKAIHALAKVGEELYLEPVPDGLCVRTVNSSRSAVMTFKFYKEFFDTFDEKCSDDLAQINSEDPMESSQNPSKCRLMMRSILMVFKSLNILEKTAETCSIQVLPIESKVKMVLKCRFRVTKVYTFPFLESERLHTDYELAKDANSFVCQAHVLNEAALNFLKNQEEVTMTAMPEKFVMKNFFSNSKESAVHTELTMFANEFEEFVVNVNTSFTFCLKELRSMIQFADAYSLPLRATYGGSKHPLFFSVEHTEALEGSLVMATMASDEHLIEIENNLNASQASTASSFRATEDLMSRNRRRNSSNVSVCFGAQNNGDQDLFNFNESVNRPGPSSATPITSTMNMENGSKPPRFSEGFDLLEQTKDLTGSPPAKKARYYFQRCFERTLDPRQLPGTDKILAPDSDDEND